MHTSVFHRIQQLSTAGLFTVMLGFGCATAQAGWELNSGSSSLFFVTTKAEHVAEVNTFNGLSGSIDDEGHASLVIDLTSVNTNIDIRDERLQEHLFETADFAKATMTLDVPAKKLNELNPGEQFTLNTSGQLSLHGSQVDITSELSVTQLASGALMIHSVKPITLDASAFDLVQGIETLREIAGLPSISHTVTVTVSLVYQK